MSGLKVTDALLRPSPAMTELFAAWIGASLDFSRFDGDDDFRDSLSETSSRTLHAMAMLPAVGAPDVVLKVFALATIECGTDEGGPFALGAPENSYDESHLWRGLIRDIQALSPAVREAIAIPEGVQS